LKPILILRYAVFHSDRFPSSVLTEPAKSIHKKDNFFRMDFSIRPTVEPCVIKG